MKRKIYDRLLEWKKRSNGKTALLIDGARRVGKSYVAEEFAKNEYSSYVIVDFARAKPALKRIFNEYLDDLDTFFLFFQRLTKTKLVRNDALVIFDEIQRFPRAREAIKYLVADGRFHYLETGSLISINKNVKNIVIPSEERHLEMFPMDFEEFLWALGDEATMPLVERCFRERLPLGDDVHRGIMDVFRQYMVVGGMPQAVQTYVQTRDLEEVDQVKRDILQLYRADIRKFGGVVRHKALAVFNAIPSQLSKHEKRIVLAEIRSGAKMRDFDSTFEWLKSAMTVNVCYNSTEPNVGLDLNTDRRTLKCYLGDTGLLISQAFGESEMTTADIQGRILMGAIEINKGMLMENVVAQMLRASGHQLFFYSNADREHAEDRMEIDFLLDKPTLTRRHNISPVEVKSTKQYWTVSLDKYRRKYSKFLAESFVLHVKDLEQVDGVTRLPVYMTPLLVKGGVSTLP